LKIGKQVFEGIKAVDFTWVGVGPWLMRQLAHHGAVVVRVETASKLDVLRLTPPFRDKVTNIDKAAYFANYNSNKYGITLNLNHPKGREVARRLIMWADVIAESFTPGTMERWGLDYKELVKLKPDLIMLSTCQQGQTGPHAKHPGYGAQLVSLAGFSYLTGWPDRGPTGPYGPYTDTMAPYFGALTIIAALDWRRKTGRGMYIDLSQFEAAIQFIAPLMLDYFVNNRIPQRMGNRDPYAAPHGAYPCQGEDRWCFIAVYTDEEWKAFCKTIGEPEWTKDNRFSSLEERKSHEDELDQLVGEWTSQHDAYEVMEKMQAAGVPAGVVQKAEDLHRDPQLEYRHYFWELEHLEIGRHRYDGPPFKLSHTPCEVKTAAPVLGQHTELVCTQLLGMSDEEFTQLLNEGVLA